MKLKLHDLVDADRLLGALSGFLPDERKGRLGVQVAYWAAKNAQRMKDELVAFEAANRALFEKYSEPVTDDTSAEKRIIHRIPSERLEAANAELDELLDKEVEFEPYLIKLDVLEKDGITLGIHDMLWIEFMIAEPQIG